MRHHLIAALAAIAGLAALGAVAAMAAPAAPSHVPFLPPMAKPKPPTHLAALSARPRDAESERQCLAEAIYFEGRSEPVEGQIAIAHVVLNRVASKTRPNRICAVVAEGEERGRGRCQFGFRCDGRPDVPTYPTLWRASLAIADQVLAGRTTDPTQGAQHFHEADARPGWTAALRPTVRIGGHVYYAE